jgi:hypothetical protein
MISTIACSTVVLKMEDTSKISASPNLDVTLVVTSCGRAALLLKTLETFTRYNTCTLHEVLIVEDGDLEHDQSLLAKTLSLPLEKVRILKNSKNLGQIQSIDRAYAEVSSQYIFHCEDDWEFYRSGFIEESCEILCSNPKVFCVWIRSHDDTNGHPVDACVQLTTEGNPYHFMATGYRGVWNGFTFNPGLRRTADCRILGPYNELSVAHELKGRTRVTESDLSIYYYRLGYRAAISSLTSGYIRHIGGEDHLANEWELRIIVKLKNLGRRLIKKIRGR